MTTTRSPAGGYRPLLLLGALIGLSVTLCACQETAKELVTASTPDDYRFRHPIAIQESNQSAVIFVGHARGGLSADQRSTVLGVAQRGGARNRRDQRRRAGRYAERSRRSRCISGSKIATRRRGGTAARDYRSPLSPGQPAPAAGDPPELYTIPPMPVRAACGRKISVLRSTTRIIPTTGSTTISAAPINATSRQ